MCITPSHIDQPDGRSEIRIGTSRGIVMLRSRSIPIEANHYINILYYFLYLTLSSSTPHDAFPTRGECLVLLDIMNFLAGENHPVAGKGVKGYYVVAGGP